MDSMRSSLWVAAGGLAVALGLAGIVLPLLPTTPFLLLASACFARGSKRLHARLLGHRVLGGCIRAFEEGRGLPARVRATAVGTLWLSMAFAIPALPVYAGRVTLAGIAVMVSAWIALQGPAAGR